MVQWQKWEIDVVSVIDCFSLFWLVSSPCFTFAHALVLCGSVPIMHGRALVCMLIRGCVDKVRYSCILKQADARKLFCMGACLELVRRAQSNFMGLWNSSLPFWLAGWLAVCLYDLPFLCTWACYYTKRLPHSPLPARCSTPLVLDWSRAKRASDFFN